MLLSLTRAVKNVVVRTPFRRPALRQAATRKITVIAYHRVDKIPNRGYPYEGNRFSASPVEFAKELEFINRHFDLISVSELIEGVQAGRLPGRPAILTFDNGYADAFKVVLPILQDVGARACFLVPTRMIGTNQVPWWDEVACCFKFSAVTSFPSPFGEWDKDYECDLKWTVPESERFTAVMRALPWPHALSYIDELKSRTRVNPSDFAEQSLFISWDQARAMAKAGMEFGSQSRTDPVLDRITDESILTDEIVGSFEDLRRELDAPPIAFAVPASSGDVPAVPVDRIVSEAGFKLSFTYAGPLADRSGSGLRRLGRFRSEFDEDFEAFETEFIRTVLG